VAVSSAVGGAVGTGVESRRFSIGEVASAVATLSVA